MFKNIVENLNKNKNVFSNKGVYFENRTNSWLTFIPKKDYIEIQWKNNGYKKQRINVSYDNFSNIEEIEKMWEDEIIRLNIQDNIKDVYKNTEKEKFDYYFITGQSFFRKNNRLFELSLKEKLQYSNESLPNDDHILNYNALFFLLKQFRIKLFINDLSVSHNIKEDFIFLNKNGNIFEIRTPLELKIILEEYTDNQLKTVLKREFVSKALNQLSKYVDTKYTGAERILKTYSV